MIKNALGVYVKLDERIPWTAFENFAEMVYNSPDAAEVIQEQFQGIGLKRITLLPPWQDWLLLRAPRETESFRGRLRSRMTGFSPPTVEGSGSFPISTAIEDIDHFYTISQIGGETIESPKAMVQDNLALAKREFEKWGPGELIGEISCKEISYAACIRAAQLLRDAAFRITVALRRAKAYTNAPLKNINIVIVSNRRYLPKTAFEDPQNLYLTTRHLKTLFPVDYLNLFKKKGEALMDEERGCQAMLLLKGDQESQ